MTAALAVPAAAYGPPGPVAPTKPARSAQRPTAGQRVDGPTCWKCDRVLADFLTTPFSLRCPRCKSQVTA